MGKHKQTHANINQNRGALLTGARSHLRYLQLLAIAGESHPSLLAHTQLDRLHIRLPTEVLYTSKTRDVSEAARCNSAAVI